MLPEHALKVVSLHPKLVLGGKSRLVLGLESLELPLELLGAVEGGVAFENESGVLIAPGLLGLAKYVKTFEFVFQVSDCVLLLQDHFVLCVDEKEKAVVFL
jgi:hypothetical protein